MPERRSVGKRKLSDDEDDIQGDVDEMDWSDEEGTFIDGIHIPAPRNTETCVRDKESRVIITKIVNTFFKSYAEQQILGPFHKCFNAIVGPNGSGKSNVIDSMLFVFGYRASKIRSKKVSVLLHNSEKHRNVQSCTVAVHFVEIIDKAEDEYEIVPNTEFVVARTAFKDNSSFYEINRKRVQFKEVANLLKKHGIDLDHNRFLILQGEVEQIAMMKSKADNEHETGMLEYLEDIIGTNRYKKPLHLLKEREEILAVQRTQKLNRLRLVQSELDTLKGPMEEAVVFLKTENQVASCKNFIYQKNIHDLEKDVKVCENEREEIATVDEQFRNELKAIANEKLEKEKVMNEQAKEYENLKKSNDTVREAFNKANNKDIELQASMTEINKNRKKCKEQLTAERKKFSALEKVPQESEEAIAECEAKEQELLIKKKKLDDEKVKLLANIRLETQDLQKQKEELQTDLIKLKNVVDETKSKYTLAESQLKISTSNEENEKNKLENLKTTYNESQQIIEQRSIEVAKLKKQIPIKEKSLQTSVNKLNTIRNQENEIINEIRKKRTSLEETKSSMQASRSRGRVLDALMQQKRDGNCPGLYGRLGDLGAIDQKYDVAISTACGPLDNLVTDTVETAQWCIEYLKKYNIGRATCIVLEKQEHLRQYANSKIKTPENVHRLYDLVQVQDETVRTAFYYALRDTLVANDLNQASRIAYGAQRYRVVTLNGDLIEMTGTMSGGGKRVSKGRMGQSVATINIDPREIERMEFDLDKYEQQVRELRQTQTILENEITALQPELRQMKIDMETFSVDLQSLEKQQPSLMRQLKEQEAKAKSTKTDPAQVKQLTKTVTETKKSYDKASEMAEALQVEVDKLSKEIDDKTLGKMKNINKNISDISKNIDKCKTEITRLNVAITTSKRNVVKCEEKITTLEQDIENAENKLKQMKVEREQIESDAQKLLTGINDIATKLVDKEENFSEIKNEVTSLTKQENKLKSAKVDNDQKLKTVDEKLNDYNTTIHQLHAKLRNLKLQEIPDQTVNELQKYSFEELDGNNFEQVERELKIAENQLKVAKPNFPAIEEYTKKRNVFMERTKDFDQVNQKHAEMRLAFDKLRNQRKDEFLKGYNIIKLKLKEVYQMITLGGDADFEMVDTFDPFAEGIQFNVRPPKKCWKNISNLSGGEKTLSSLALVFALHYYKPSPLYVMDEIDAALDFKNVSIIGHYIKERTKNAQFIIISLRSNMYELCDQLVGIYKTFNCTKTVVLNPKPYNKAVEDPNAKTRE